LRLLPATGLSIDQLVLLRLPPTCAGCGNRYTAAVSKFLRAFLFFLFPRSLVLARGCQESLWPFSCFFLTHYFLAVIFVQFPPLRTG
jgi:hypothetical protein